jgi:hypothetical protein
MHIDCFKVNTVLVAKGHNPTILHPSFLKNEKIVPHDWELSKDPICTPPFATVAFTSGFSFVVELERLQVAFNGENADSQVVAVSEMARKYAEKLPHVMYTAVGINLSIFCEFQEPERFLLQRFVKDGPWNSNEMPVASTKQHFTYVCDDHQLHVSIESGQRQNVHKKERQRGVILHANYHAECSQKSNPLDSVRNLLQKAEERKDHFQHLTQVFLGSDV